MSSNRINITKDDIIIPPRRKKIMELVKSINIPKYLSDAVSSWSSENNDHFLGDVTPDDVSIFTTVLPIDSPEEKKHAEKHVNPPLTDPHGNPT